jgi:hypothetical protein
MNRVPAKIRKRGGKHVFRQVHQADALKPLRGHPDMALPCRGEAMRLFYMTPRAARSPMASSV